MRRSFLVLSLVSSALAATASGFDNGAQGARILGLGGASTAYAGSIAAIYTNPGLLGQWADTVQRTHLSLGGLAQSRRASFVSLETFARTDQELTIQPGGYLYATHTINSRLAVGLALNTPYGYHSQWPSTWDGRSVVQESQLSTYSAQPTVAYKLGENFSIGAGLLYTYGRYEQTRALGQFDDPSAQARYKASGSGFGFSAGIYGRTGDNLAFGISFRSPVKLKMDGGTATYANVPARDAVLYPASAALDTRLTLPSQLSVGLSDKVTKNLLLTFDFTLAGWSTLDSLNFDIAASGSVPASRVVAKRGYEDALAFRIGAEYQPTAKLSVLAGLYYDETPVRDEYITPEFVDANRIGGSLGLVYQLTPKLALEGAYSFGYGQERTARASTDQERVSSISGTYRLAAHNAALGVSVAF
jgi:long-chain fatty acid transport protein